MTQVIKVGWLRCCRCCWVCNADDAFGSGGAGDEVGTDGVGEEVGANF